VYLNHDESHEGCHSTNNEKALHLWLAEEVQKVLPEGKTISSRKVLYSCSGRTVYVKDKENHTGSY